MVQTESGKLYVDHKTIAVNNGLSVLAVARKMMRDGESRSSVVRRALLSMAVRDGFAVISDEEVERESGAGRPTVEVDRNYGDILKSTTLYIDGEKIVVALGDTVHALAHSMAAHESMLTGHEVSASAIFRKAILLLAVEEGHAKLLNEAPPQPEPVTLPKVLTPTHRRRRRQ